MAAVWFYNKRKSMGTTGAIYSTAYWGHRTQEKAD